MQPSRRAVSSSCADQGLIGHGTIPSSKSSNSGGVTLLEMVVTVAIIMILAAVAVPTVKVVGKRAQELELRQKLREMRIALDRFHEDWAREGDLAKGQYCTKNKSSCLEYTGSTGYPKKFETLLGIPLSNDSAESGGTSKGVNQASGTMSLRDSLNDSPLKDAEEKPTVKRYLRQIPLDPMTGTQDWGLRCYKDPPGSDRWCSDDVFDVFTKSTSSALNNKSRYRDW